MKSERNSIGDIVIVRINEKNLTSHEAPELKTALLELFMGEGEYFILNLKDVEHMDSTGLGAFLFGVRQAERYDKDLVFCELSERIRSLIRIAQLEQVFEVYTSEPDAVREIEKEKKDNGLG
ncbi:MAG TPA: anti-sigma factor antagonist [bacterium]|nr:anti-sigma factor antagonist [bacterium]